MESTKNQLPMQDIRTSSATRESVLPSHSTVVSVLFTHTWSLTWKSTLLRKRNTLKNENEKCTQCSTNACLAIQTTMNRMESANFLMMNLVHRNLQPFRISLRVLIHENDLNRRESTPLRLLRSDRRSVISLLFTRIDHGDAMEL